MAAWNLSKTFLELQSFDEFEAIWAGLGLSGKAAIYGATIFSLVNFLPSIMLSIRRFHDLNQTGWLVLAFFIFGNMAYLGLFVSLANFIWFSFPGTDGPNQYGPDPLGHDPNIFS